MKLTIILSDKLIGIDGQFVSITQQDLSWVPSNIHAVQWYNTWGEVEYTDGTFNEKIEELGIFEQAIDVYNNEKKRLEDEERLKNEALEASIDYWKELRILRDDKLFRCDWTQVPDAPLTEVQIDQWKIYRQTLRDLPENITDPKPLVKDVTNSNWPVPPA